MHSWAQEMNVCKQAQSADSPCVCVYYDAKKGCRGGCEVTAGSGECGTTSGPLCVMQPTLPPSSSIPPPWIWDLVFSWPTIEKTLSRLNNTFNPARYPLDTHTHTLPHSPSTPSNFLYLPPTTHTGTHTPSLHLLLKPMYCLTSKFNLPLVSVCVCVRERDLERGGGPSVQLFMCDLSYSWVCRLCSINRERQRTGNAGW